MSDIDLVLWTASVRSQNFDGCLKAARAGGFTSIAIPPEMYVNEIAGGAAPQDMKKKAVDGGTPLGYLDTCSGWAPVRVPREAHPLVQARYDIDMDTSFRICEELGLHTILAVAGYDLGACSRDEIMDGFGALCERAAGEGIHVDLEFMPFWGMPNLSDAWDIVKTVDAPNSGILVDTWHFANGDQDMELLRSIPGKYLTGMQICDGARDHQGRTVFEERIDYSKFPGEGELDVVEMIRIVAEKGHLKHVGPEVFSLEADALSVEEAGRRSADSTRAVMTEAGVSMPG